MHHVGLESAQHAHHSRTRHSQRQRGDLRKHLRWQPMHPDSVVNPLCGWLAARSIGGDNQDFVTGVTEMLDYPKHRVGDAVDIREERLCDDRNAHNQIVPSAADAKVANRDMTREKPVRTMGGAKRLSPDTT